MKEAREHFLIRLMFFLLVNTSAKDLQSLIASTSRKEKVV